MAIVRIDLLKGLALAGATVILVALVGCSGDQGTSFQPAFQGGPRLSLDRTTLDFGEVPAGKSLSAVFQLQNVGDKPLVIEKAFTRVVEGCCPTQPDLEPSEIPQGKSSTLARRFTMAEGMTGLHVFEVLISSNDMVEPEARLTVRALFIED